MISLSPRQQRRALSILVISAVIIWLDTTIMGIALERLSDPVLGIGASPGDLQWAIGAYSLIFATALFAAGALGDRYGHRAVLMAGLTVFGAASAAAAWSSTATGLIAARAAMGAGGALIVPASMSLISWTFPAERRAGAIAVFSASSGVGVAAGPLLGGVLIDHFWWGSIFLANLPIVLIGLIGVALFVPNPPSQQHRRFDPAGVALSTIGLLLLAYGLIEGGQSQQWSNAKVWGSIVTGVGVLTAFVLVELRISQPSFDPRLFRNRRFAAGNLALGAMFLAITGQVFYGNFFLQGARGMSALDSGLAFLPGALGVIVGAPISARLVHRFGVRAVAGIALAMVCVTFAANLAYTVDTPLAWFCVVGAVQGIGIGAAVAPLTAAILASLPIQRMGAGSAVNNTVRQVGSVLGIAALGTILTSVYRHGIAPTLAGVPESARTAAAGSAEATRHVAAQLGRPDLAESANRVFIHAMHVTASWGAVITLAGAAAVLLAFRTPREPAVAAGPARTDAGEQPSVAGALTRGG
jgi:EmrB/QacA subfamily drug resistance transporter